MTKETTKSVYASLHRIQISLKAPKEKGNSKVAYKSRSAEQILEAAKGFLQDGEVIICNDEIINIGDRFYVKSTATLCIDDNCVSAVGHAREPENSPMMQPPQLTGSSSSYARKYALGGLFAIDDSSDDPDKKEAITDQPTPKKEVTPEVEQQRKDYENIATALKGAKDFKNLNIIWQLHEKTINALPLKGKEGLEQIHSDRTAELSTLNAG